MRTVVWCASLLGLLSLSAAGLEAEDGVRAGAVQTAQLTHTLLLAPEAIVSRPTEKASDKPQGMNDKDPAALKRIEFKGKGSATIDLCGQSISLTAHADGSVSVRADGREQLLRPVPKGGTIQSAHLLFGETRKYALAFPTRTGTGADATLTYRSGAAQVATIDGESVWFYDHNTDGIYAVGDDAVRVGDPTKVAVFAPLSSYVATANGIYEITQLAEDGSQVQYRKYGGATGNLAVQFAGGSAEINLVIASADGRLSTVVAAGAKTRPPVMLFPGHYDLIAAIVTAPGQGKVVSVLENASVPSIDIAEGQTTTLELGAPLALEFKADLKTTTQVSIDGVRVRGRSGEAYRDLLWNGQPDVSVVTAGALRKLGKFGAAQGASAACYTGQVPENPGHLRRKIVIMGTVDGLGSVRGESPLE